MAATTCLVVNDECLGFMRVGKYVRLMGPKEIGISAFNSIHKVEKCADVHNERFLDERDRDRLPSIHRVLISLRP